MMFSTIFRNTIAAAFGLAVLASASAANAAVIDISATVAGGTTVNVTAGDYLIQWIGIADGGLYNAANTNCPTGDCTSGWSDAFAVKTIPFGANDTINYFDLGGYSSALASLSAVRSASSVNHGVIDFTGGVPGPFHFVANVSQPWIVTLDNETLNFNIPDGDGSLTNNFGGVSLRITAVPEPATWAMFLIGLGGIGFMLRNSRRQGIAAAV